MILRAGAPRGGTADRGEEVRVGEGRLQQLDVLVAAGVLDDPQVRGAGREDEREIPVGGAQLAVQIDPGRF